MFKKGELLSGVSTFHEFEALVDPKKGLLIPIDLDIKLKKKPKNRRNLVTVTGDKPILAVRVTDAAGRVHPDSTHEISDNIFGTYGDTMNLKSQLGACSFSQLNVTAGIGNEHEVHPGVTEVTINVELVNPYWIIQNDVSVSLRAKLGLTSLPGPYQQIMYVVERCYYSSTHDSCGWAAYAYINSWLSVYRWNYYKYSTIQVHELGHNFGLAHSGYREYVYGDHTCSMGNPCYGDDLCAMCFNPAKNFQLGWYSTHHKILDPKSTPYWTGRLVGIADFDNNPDNHPVVLKIETGTSLDQFIGFNRATGVNRENDLGDDTVTVIETGRNGEAYSMSWLKSYMAEGEWYTLHNWAYIGKDLVVTVDEIDLNPGGGSPGYADITVKLVEPGECRKLLSEFCFWDADNNVLNECYSASSSEVVDICLFDTDISPIPEYAIEAKVQVYGLPSDCSIDKVEITVCCDDECEDRTERTYPYMSFGDIDRPPYIHGRDIVPDGDCYVEAIIDDEIIRSMSFTFVDECPNEI